MNEKLIVVARFALSFLLVVASSCPLPQGLFYIRRNRTATTRKEKSESDMETLDDVNFPSPSRGSFVGEKES